MGRQTWRRDPHLGIESAHIPKVGHRRRDGADEGAAASAGSNGEVVVVVRLFGAVEPLEPV